MTDNQDLIKLLKDTAKYNTYIYNQIPTLYDSWNNDYKIEYLYDKVPSNSILLVLPCFSSETPNKNTPNVTLSIRYIYSYKTLNNELVPIYREQNYTVYVETQEGTLKKASKGDIIANRLCIFRFIEGDIDSVILVNSPLYNSVSLSTLTVTNKTKFYQKPIVILQNDQEVQVVTQEQLNSLEARVEQLENKFQYGTQDPQEAMIDMPNGSIYIQVEKGY